MAERMTYLLVDGENIDATLGTSILGRRPRPEERPRWDRLLQFAERALGPGRLGPVLPRRHHRAADDLRAGAAGDRLHSRSRCRRRRARRSSTSPSSAPLEALVDREADVLLVSHDGDFVEQVSAPVRRQPRSASSASPSSATARSATCRACGSSTSSTTSAPSTRRCRACASSRSTSSTRSTSSEVPVPVVLVPPARWERWVDNFATRHGVPTSTRRRRRAARAAADGSHFAARLPFAASYDGPPEAAASRRRPGRRASGACCWCARAGSPSPGCGGADGRAQDRPAARAGAHQGRGPEPAALRPAPRQPGAAGLRGGRRPRGADPAAGAPRGRPAATTRPSTRCSPTRGCAGLTVVDPWLAVPDPRRAVLDQAIPDAQSIVVDVTNA